MNTLRKIIALFFFLPLQIICFFCWPFYLVVSIFVGEPFSDAPKNITEWRRSFHYYIFFPYLWWKEL